jgi:two-component system LytT family response regulator
MLMQETYSAVIVEDEKGDAELLRSLLDKYPNIDCKGHADSVMRARNMILELQPDLLFLDIDLYGDTAFDLLDKIKEYNLHFYIIFTTAYNEYAIQAIKYSALDYLLKPIEIDALEQALSRMTNIDPKSLYLQSKIKKLTDSFKKIVVEQTGKDIYLDPEDILYLQAVKGESYTEIITINDKKNIIVSKGLGEFEKKLLGVSFYKVHRSITINKMHLKEIDSAKGFIKIGDTKISLSKKKARELKQRFRERFG